MDGREKTFIKEVQDYMLSATNMAENEAYDFAFRLYRSRHWVISKLSKIMYEDTEEKWHDKDW